MHLHELFRKHKALKTHDYGFLLHQILDQFRDDEGSLLEIGLGKEGGSIKAYQEFLPHFTFYSIDINPHCQPKGVTIFRGNQSDTEFLSTIAEEAGPFSIIIDDGGHWDYKQKASLDVLYPHLTQHGLYIIEDLQVADERTTEEPTMINYIKQNMQSYVFYPTQRSLEDLCVITKPSIRKED